MELEETGHRTLNIGPKKYVVEQKDGSYTWHANGIRAKQNVGVDVRASLVSAFRGEAEKVNHFAINQRVDFQLCHTEPGESNKIRFVCLEGRSKVHTPARLTLTRRMICGSDGGRTKRNSRPMRQAKSR